MKFVNNNNHVALHLVVGLALSCCISAAPLEYSFQCGTDMYICGGMMVDRVCNSDDIIKYKHASREDCKGMVAAITSPPPGTSVFQYKCPNNKVISNYMKYEGCIGGAGFVTDSSGTKQCECPAGACGTIACSEGTVGGDPHFRTHDGTMYSYHGECDLVMARSPSFGSGLGLEVHARTQIVTDWSLVSNAVVRIGDDVFEVVNDGTYIFNGVANVDLPLLMAGKYKVEKLEKVLRIKEGTNEKIMRTWYNVDLMHGDIIKMSLFKDMIGVNVAAALPDTQGMLGSSSKSGLVGRDGRIIGTNSNEMGNQWQVNNTEPMLFHEVRSPQYPEQCKLPRVDSRRRLLRQSSAMAKDACSNVPDEALRNFCIEDVMITGDIDSANNYGDVF